MSLVYEGGSGLLTGKIVDNGTGLGIQPATLTLFIYDRDTGTAFLGTAVAPVNLTPVATYVDASGNLTYYIGTAANVIQTAGKEIEIHVARFAWTWTAQGATQTGREEIQFDVTNLTP